MRLVLILAIQHLVHLRGNSLHRVLHDLQIRQRRQNPKFLQTPREANPVLAESLSERTAILRAWECLSEGERGLLSEEECEGRGTSLLNNLENTGIAPLRS